MSTTEEAAIQQIPLAQAIELLLLVDLEARWENMRIYQPAAEKTPTLHELLQKQKAHEAFFAKLGTYNKSHKPAHVAELLLNNPSRLRRWCRSMRDLVLQVQHDPQAHYPTHMLEKAYRWADRIAGRMKKERIARATPSTTIPGAVQELEDVARWCDNLAAS
jgi:hypothetical protein